MILVDTSIWVDHLRGNDARLERLLGSAQVSVHPYVIGEIALGNLRNRIEILELLDSLPMVAVASHDEVMDFISNYSLGGRGLGYIDVHLLAAVKLTPQTTLWSRDKRLVSAALGLSIPAVSTP